MEQVKGAIAGGVKAELVVIPTASAAADKGTADATIALWKKRGAGEVRILHTRSRNKANDAEFVKPLTTATAIWLESLGFSEAGELVLTPDAAGRNVLCGVRSPRELAEIFGA